MDYLQLLFSVLPALLVLRAIASGAFPADRLLRGRHEQGRGHVHLHGEEIVVDHAVVLRQRPARGCSPGDGVKPCDCHLPAVPGVQPLVCVGLEQPPEDFLRAFPRRRARDARYLFLGPPSRIA